MDNQVGTSAGSSPSPTVVLATNNIPVSSPAVVSIPSPQLQLNMELLKAATSGDVGSMQAMAGRLLLEITPQGNTCLHIASMHGHERFCKGVIALNPDLLDIVNMDGETPLLVALTSGHLELAIFLLGQCRERQLSSAILKQDKHGCNALHHAIRSGHTELALILIEAQPDLSYAVNCDNESPMFIAASRDFMDVFVRLFNIPGSALGGARGYNVLHAAVSNGNQDILRSIMGTTHRELAKEEDFANMSPVLAAAYDNKIDILKLFLECDPSLGYLIPTTGQPLLCTAAWLGHVGVARELLKHCADAPFRNRTDGWTCLHTAVYYGKREFVKFILGTHILWKLINMRNEEGETALHLAVKKCNPKMVAALLRHPDIDITVLSQSGQTATWVLLRSTDHAKTLNWNEVYMLLRKADPNIATSTYILHGAAKDRVTDESRKDIKALTTKYTTNTSLVAILIATITFAAAFTLPGGNQSDGHPIMARNLAFQAFLISDTLAMCSSLAVAFVCIIANWEDLEFLLYYRSFTTRLMWFAYMATTIAFSTGLYTVMAPRLLWLAVPVCLLTVLLPILTMVLGEWPIWKPRIQLRQNFMSDLLDMV